MCDDNVYNEIENKNIIEIFFQDSNDLDTLFIIIK